MRKIFGTVLLLLILCGDGPSICGDRTARHTSHGAKPGESQASWINFRSSSPITSARAGLAMLLLNVRFGYSFEAFTCALTSRVALTRILLLKMLTHQ
jgi:hypothetical protein